MAFNKRALSGNVGVGAGVPTAYKYNSDDDYNLVQSGGYFNEANLSLEVNDLIYAQTADKFAILRVTSITVPITVSAEFVEV